MSSKIPDEPIVFPPEAKESLRSIQEGAAQMWHLVIQQPHLKSEELEDFLHHVDIALWETLHKLRKDD